MTRKQTPLTGSFSPVEFKYSEEQADVLYKTIYKHLLPKYKNEAEKKRIISESERAVGLIWAVSTIPQTGQRITKAELSKLKTASARFMKYLKLIDEETREYLVSKINESPPEREEMSRYAKGIGFPGSEYLRPVDVIYWVEEIHKFLDGYLQPLYLSKNQAHRPPDDRKQMALGVLVTLFSNVTGKKTIGLNGPLQRFLEDAFPEKHKNYVKGFLRRLKKTD